MSKLPQWLALLGFLLYTPSLLSQVTYTFHCTEIFQLDAVLTMPKKTFVVGEAIPVRLEVTSRGRFGPPIDPNVLHCVRLENEFGRAFGHSMGFDYCASDMVIGETRVFTQDLTACEGLSRRLPFFSELPAGEYRFKLHLYRQYGESDWIDFFVEEPIEAEYEAYQALAEVSPQWVAERNVVSANQVFDAVKQYPDSPYAFRVLFYLERCFSYCRGDEEKVFLQELIQYMLAFYPDECPGGLLLYDLKHRALRLQRNTDRFQQIVDSFSIREKHPEWLEALTKQEAERAMPGSVSGR